MNDDLIDKIRRMEDITKLWATGDRTDTPKGEYMDLRRELMGSVEVRPHLPGFVMRCRDLPSFWGYIQPMFPSYKERRVYLADAFAPLMERLEGAALTPPHRSVADALQGVTWSNVQYVWEKIVERQPADPDDAITAARSVVESVLKHILDERGIAYTGGDDLPALYNKVSRDLNIEASQQTVQTLRQIMSGCKTVVDGLAALRNQHGDAHGVGAAHVIEPLYAELAVNTAGTLASFLIRVHESRSN